MFPSPTGCPKELLLLLFSLILKTYVMGSWEKMGQDKEKDENPWKMWGPSGEVFPYLFQFLENVHIPWLWFSFFHVQSQPCVFSNPVLSFYCGHKSPWLLTPCLVLRILVIPLGPMDQWPWPFPHLKILHYIAKSLLLCKVICSQVQEMRT